MPSLEEAIRLLDGAGEAAAAEHVRAWRNRHGTTGGWDANLKLTYPSVCSLVWPDAGARGAAQGMCAPRVGRGPVPAQTVRLARPSAPTFDAYVMIDWSASSLPNTGPDSIWWACLEWEAGGARISCANCSTRADRPARVLRTDWAPARAPYARRV